jgi:hypothetical protein
MRNGFPAALLWLLLPTLSLAQDWKQVHKADDAKWAKATGLDSSVIHKLWKMASRFPNEKDDDSRIANVDLDGLAERHHVLFVTYAGEKNCLTITVFNQLTESAFAKIWSADNSPDGQGFCDTQVGNAKAEAGNGVIQVRVPRTQPDASGDYIVYEYAWNGITYRCTGQRQVQGRP